jgi:hypothetical protein
MVIAFYLTLRSPRKIKKALGLWLLLYAQPYTPTALLFPGGNQRLTYHEHETMVSNHARNDRDKRKLEIDSAQIHDITIQIARAYVLRQHAGIFQFLLDRITNKDSEGRYAVHFPDPQNPFTNVQNSSKK